MTMGERIKSLRLEVNMTQEELGEKLGVQKSAVNKWEKGEVENIKRNTLEKMSEIFQKSPLYIMAFDEWDKREKFPIVTVEKVNDILVTTSNRVAEELEVNHRDLLEKIDSYIEKFQSAELSAGFYIPSEYKDTRNRTYRNYLITEKGIAQLIGGYSAAVPKAFALNVAYINEFERMRKILKEEFRDKMSPKSSITFEQMIEIANVIRKTPVSSMDYVFKVLKVFVPELEMLERKNQVNIQEELSNYLKEHNLNINKFCNQTGLAKSNVWNWLNGKTKPSKSNVQIITNIIGD